MPASVGRYQLLGPLGVGGMASVYLALVQGAAGFQREVALKVLHPHLVGDKSLVRQFLAEARVCSRIRHPNVVPVIDVAEDDTNVYLVMDFVEGDSLSGLRKSAREAGTPLPQPVWLRFLCDALAGLHAAHELKESDGTSLGLVHRDFTPQNILIGLDGMARLSDFGIAKLASTPSHTVSGVIKGKVNYMAPEQVRGDPLDRRCDVWAAGVLAWEMATGNRLRKGRDANIQTLLEIIDTAPPPLTKIVPGFPQALSDVVASALALDPAKRCPSAADFRSALMSAATNNGGIADYEACAAWVQKLSVDKIRERREKLGQVKQLREQLASLLVEEAQGQSDSLPPASIAAAVFGEQTGETRSTSSVETRKTFNERHTNPKRWLLGAALTAVAAGGGYMLLGRSATPQPMHSSVASAAATAVTRAVALASRTTKPSRVELELRANEKIAALTLDGRAITIDEPASALRIALPAWARPREELQIDATAVTGARASQLWRDASPVQLAFPPAPKNPAVPAVRVRPTPKPGKKPLAKNPYAR
jgi:serine/threonine protein kinase